MRTNRWLTRQRRRGTVAGNVLRVAYLAALVPLVALVTYLLAIADLPFEHLLLLIVATLAAVLIGTGLVVVAVHQTIGDLEMTIQHWRQLAHTDHLTGLLNRAALKPACGPTQRSRSLRMTGS